MPVHAVSNVTGEGVEALAPYFAEGRTVAALGSSGVGKSSLVNRLAGEELMATGDLRADGRGRHTTTNRQLLLLPGGGLFLDTPGMRELRLWESDEGLATAFDDVAAAAALCRFTDCSHEAEPGCGVRAALADGTLDPERYDSWRKLQGELQHLAMKQDSRLRAEARKERRRFARSRSGRRRGEPPVEHDRDDRHPRRRRSTNVQRGPSSEPARPPSSIADERAAAHHAVDDGQHAAAVALGRAVQ